MFPLFRLLAPNVVSTLDDVAKAMREVVKHGYEKPVLEVRDINALAASAK